MSKPDLTNVHYLTPNRIIGKKRLEREVRNNMKHNRVIMLDKLYFAFTTILVYLLYLFSHDK